MPKCCYTSRLKEGDFVFVDIVFAVNLMSAYTQLCQQPFPHRNDFYGQVVGGDGFLLVAGND